MTSTISSKFASPHVLQAVSTQETLALPVRGSGAHRQGAAFDADTAMTAREQRVSAREDAALLRENAARQHDDAFRAALARVAKVADLRQDFDVLTGLPDRLLMQERLARAIALARIQRGRLALLFIGLDRFKHINDSLGHALGDQLLRSTAQCLLSCTDDRDAVSRTGGDEFAFLLPMLEGGDGRDSAAVCARTLLAALRRPQRIAGHDLHPGASIGIAIFPDDGQDVATLMQSADSAMVHAKENGGNDYLFFMPDMNARAERRQAIEAGLRRALERQELVLHYQPKINLQSGMLVGVEALIRWQHPQLGLLLPSEFVPVAEGCGLILPIGRWVLREACLQAWAWRRAGLPPITVAVNTSALEFRAADFLDNVRATLAETGMPAGHLELELTENVLMRDTEASNGVLQALAELGVRLAVDDFGTGYSSLSYLRQFPVDTVKIDQSFLNQVSSNPDDASIVSAVISMGQSLNKCVVAEGVETEEQYAFLLARHCDVGQGYYFGRPVPAAELAPHFGRITSAGLNSQV